MKSSAEESSTENGSVTQLPQAVEIGNSEEITRNDSVTTHPPTVDYGHSEEILKSVSATPLLTAVNNGNPEEIPNNKSSNKNFSFNFVSAGEVSRIIKRLKKTKAMGIDEIQVEVWKKGVVVLAGPIAQICNLSLKSGVFPDIFKHSIIHPVFKGHGKDPRDPGSYRPISILPALSKILEIVVRDALLDWLKLQDFIPESQFGFLPGRSVTAALASAQSEWVKAKSKGDTVGVMAFDLSSAFDTVSCNKLLAKLESARINGRHLEWFKLYMHGRSQKVLWNDTLSAKLPVSYGVPQGSILGPILFIVMIADMPKRVLGNMGNAKTTGYADDSTVYTHAKNAKLMKKELEILANRMTSYCQSSGLILNSDKTQLLVSPKQDFQIEIGQNVIKASSKITLLGVDFDTNFTTIPYLHKLASEANTRASLIYRLSFSMPPHVLATLANGLLMGKILASCPVTIPLRINDDDRSGITVTEEINKAIKSTARTITKTKLSDKVHSEDVLKKANLKCLNEAVASIVATTVWKSKQSMDPLGQCIFREKQSIRTLRSVTSNEIPLPVPGYPTLTTNLMARVWNSVPELHTATSLTAARFISKKWAKVVPR